MCMPLSSSLSSCPIHLSLQDHVSWFHENKIKQIKNPTPLHIYIYAIASVSLMEHLLIQQYFSKALEKMRIWVLCMCVGWGGSVLVRGHSPHGSFPSWVSGWQRGHHHYSHPAVRKQENCGNYMNKLCTERGAGVVTPIIGVLGVTLSEMGRY